MTPEQLTQQTKHLAPNQPPKQSPLMKRTVLANNAIESQRAFYADALQESLEQNQRDASLIQQMGGQVNQLRAQLQEAVKESTTISDGAEEFLEKVKELVAGALEGDTDVAKLGEGMAALKKLVEQYEEDDDDGDGRRVDRVEPPVGTARQG